MSLKYFYDCEFIESGYGQPLDLISIGIVCEDGREFYAVNDDCNWSRANSWVRQNVLKPTGIFQSPENDNGMWFISPETDYYTFPREVIALEILEFVKAPYINCDIKLGVADEIFESERYKYLHELELPEKPEFWAWYADYDHVMLSQLFGTMMDLPKGFPMYTRDIKQWCDQLGNPKLPEQEKGEHIALEDAKWNKLAWEFLKQCEQDRLALEV